MPVVWTDRHRLHEPKGEVWLGVWIEGTEVPARGERIRQALEEAGASFVDPRAYDDGPIRGRPRPRLSLVSRQRIRRMGGRRIPRRARAGPRRAVCLPAPPADIGEGATPARSGLGAHWDVRHGHDDPDRSRHLGGGQSRRRGRADRSRPGRRRHPCRIRRLPATGTPRRPRLLRRVLLPEQRRHRRTAAALPRHPKGWDHRPRRPPRQRDSGDLLPACPTWSTPRSTSIRVRDGFPTSSGTTMRPAMRTVQGRT